MPSRLSVIIPFYNSGTYLTECLESVAAQDFSDMEVILVDDGSTDESPTIARGFAARDTRFRAIRQEDNKGPGSARNAGVAHSDPRSNYLAFMDSDDLLPKKAYEILTAALDSSGSDFSAGNVLRFSSSGLFPSEKYACAFRENRTATHISKIPSLAMDRTMWNKVYRRTFWDRCGLSFPEGMFYEDSPVSIPLHFMASAVDIISDTIYHWRIRETGEPSITQQRTIQAMCDRFTSIDMIRNFLKGLRAKSTASFLVAYDRNILEEELPLFFDELIEASDHHRRAFVQQAAILLGDIESTLVAEIPQSLREKYSAIESGRVSHLMRSLTSNSI